MEESKEPRPEGTQDIPEPLGMEMAGAESGLEPPAEAADPRLVGPAPSGRRDLVPTALGAAIVAFAAVGIFVLGMFTHAVAFDDDDGGPTVQVGPGGQGAPGVAQPTPGPVDVSADDDPAKGPEDAAVTIIEFSDFQCSFCARFQSETLPQILNNYGDRVRFVYRDFPLTSIHPFALKAAEAAECADDQDAFWKYHDLLFQNQGALDEESLKRYAADAGLDTTAFNECLASGKHTAEVRKDVEDGLKAGVQGTPAFFINGRLLSGAQPYPVFQAAIEAALAETGE